jgi:hypothetical protein
MFAMVLRKTVGTAKVNLGPARLFLDDIELFIEILRSVGKDPDEPGINAWTKSRRTVKLSLLDYEIDTVADLEQLPARPDTLTIALEDPRISVRLWGLGMRVEAPDTPAGLGVIEKIRAQVDAHCRPFGFQFFRPSVVPLLAGFISVLGWYLGYFLADSLAFSPAGRPFFGITMSILLVLLYLYAGFVLNQPVVFLVRRKAHQTFWRSYKDKILPSIVSGVVVGTVMLLIGLFVGRVRSTASPAEQSSGSSPFVARQSDAGHDAP